MPAVLVKALIMLNSPCLPLQGQCGSLMTIHISVHSAKTVSHMVEICIDVISYTPGL